MRIAFLTPEFVTEAYFAGGLAQYLGRVVTGLVQRGHNVEIFVTAESNEEVSYQGVLVHRVRPEPWFPLRLVNGLRRLIGRGGLAEAQRICSVAKGLDGALRRRSKVLHFDVVQAASWMATGYFAAKRQRQAAPVVVRVSSYEPLWAAARMQERTLDKRIACYIELAAMKRASAVYAPSKFLAGEISTKTGLNIQVVQPPFYSKNSREDSSATRRLGDWRNYLLFFGRVARHKGAGVLADAIEPLFENLPGLRLAMAGPISEGDTAAKRLLELATSFPERVRYLGVLPQEQLLSIIRKARAVVLPSLMDNLPNSCLEALSLGKVVIGPNGVSFDELITDGESGILFELAKPDSLRRAILRAWNLSEAEHKHISESAKARIAHLSPNTVLYRLEQLFENVISCSASDSESN